MDFEGLRSNLLTEAKSSPKLLSDLAGLESYISQSYYNRSFIELLQNADDAGATKFLIMKKEEALFVANDGRLFNHNDLESLCRSASSNKVKGESIGYRGIGFKSVVGFTTEIHLISGDLELTFSRNRTKSEVPEASRVPLIRIPHRLKNSDKELLSPTLEILKSKGYTTIFVFTDIIANNIESEFNSFEYNSLIFLRNIQESIFLLSNLITARINKKQISETEISIAFDINESSTNWHIFNYNHCSIAFSVVNNEIVKLSPEKSLIHSFLPTEDRNGLGVLINGNFSTDPSRRHIIYDEETMSSIKLCCNYILKLLESNLKNNTEVSVNLVNALMPESDPRMLQFTKISFSKVLFENLQQIGLNFFKELKLCPNWLNHKDFILLSASMSIKVVNLKFYEIQGFNSFAKYMGATETDFHELKYIINKVELSVIGCAQLVQYIFKLVLSHEGIAEADLLELKIFYSEGKRISLKELNRSCKEIDDSFILILRNNGLSDFDISYVIKQYAPESKYVNEFKRQEGDRQPKGLSSDGTSVLDWYDILREKSHSVIKSGAKRWRNAEEVALAILNFNGFKLEDVSKQNIGYDLGGLVEKSVILTTLRRF